MFAELQAFADANPWLSAHAILRMATINGARALGRQRTLGQLTHGALADFIALPLTKEKRIEELRRLAGPGGRTRHIQR